MLESLIQTLAISALPVIFAITLHEAAHGRAQGPFGVQTARGGLHHLAQQPLPQLALLVLALLLRQLRAHGSDPGDRVPAGLGQRLLGAGQGGRGVVSTERDQGAGVVRRQAEGDKFGH